MRLPAAFEHVWILFIAVTLLNGAIWWHRSRPHRERQPELTSGYASIVRGFVTWGNLPWLVMGAGILSGAVPSVVAYFHPRSANPFVTAFYGSVLLLWALGTWWLVARNGAEQLASHPGILQRGLASPAAVKGLWFLCLAGGVAGLSLLYFGDFAPPA